MQLQYLSHWILLCSPVTNKTSSTQLHVAVSSGVCPASKCVHPATSPTASPLSLLYLVAAALKHVSASLTGCSLGTQWGVWAGFKAVKHPDLPHDIPAASSHQNPAIYAQYYLTL